MGSSAGRARDRGSDAPQGFGFVAHVDHDQIADVGGDRLVPDLGKRQDPGMNRFVRDELDHAVLAVRKAAPEHGQAQHPAGGEAAAAGRQQTDLGGHAFGKRHAHAFLDHGPATQVDVRHGLGIGLEVIAVAQGDRAEVLACVPTPPDPGSRNGLSGSTRLPEATPPEAAATRRH